MKRFEDWAGDLADELAAKESINTSAKPVVKGVRVKSATPRPSSDEWRRAVQMGAIGGRFTADAKAAAGDVDTLVSVFDAMSPEEKHSFMVRVAGDPVASMTRTYCLMAPKQKFCFLTSIGAWEEHAPHSPRLAKVSLTAYFDKKDI